MVNARRIILLLFFLTVLLVSLFRHSLLLGQERSLEYFNWDRYSELESGANERRVSNAIAVAQEYDEKSNTFAYYTGGFAQGIGDFSEAPARIVAREDYGSVSVTFRYLGSDSEILLTEMAQSIARSIAAVTENIWPGETTAVDVDYYIMPPKSPYSLAHRVDWGSGESFYVATFSPRDAPLDYRFPAHELYHVLSHRWGVRSKNYPYFSQLLFEEVAADLFGACGRLISEGELSLFYRIRIGFSVVEGRSVERPLKGDLVFVLDRVMKGDKNYLSLRSLLTEAIAAKFFPTGGSFDLGSSKANRFISLCEEGLRNPMKLVTWLRDTAN